MMIVSGTFGEWIAAGLVIGAALVGALLALGLGWSVEWIAGAAGTLTLIAIARFTVWREQLRERAEARRCGHG